MSLFRILVWSQQTSLVGAALVVALAPVGRHQAVGLGRHILIHSREYSLLRSFDHCLHSSLHDQRQRQRQRQHPSRLFANKRQDVNSSFQQDFTQVKQEVQYAMTLFEKNLRSATSAAILQAAIADLEREQSNPDFWDDSNNERASSVNAQLSEYTRLLTRIQQWQRWAGDCQAALEMLQEDKDHTSSSSSSSSSTAGDGLLSVDEQQMLVQELRDACTKLQEDGQTYELELLLSGPYDSAPARLTLTAGAGGTEANDWVADLKRMYERHAAKMGFTCTVEDSQSGDVGFKSVDMLITGPNAYGWFQGEKGAHRLVRLSPFNANNKRQTTFAGVDVAPDVLNEDDIKDIHIPDNEMEITTMRSGGAGGQNVNKLDTAVRIKHLPSGLQVKCTQERSQSMNREIALKRLKAQLLVIAREQRVQEIKEIRGDIVEASWGAQIRNYVLHPYKMVKDQRTGWETSNAQAFLDGELLDDCIGAYLRHKADQEAATET